MYLTQFYVDWLVLKLVFSIFRMDMRRERKKSIIASTTKAYHQDMTPLEIQLHIEKQRERRFDEAEELLKAEEEEMSADMKEGDYTIMVSIFLTLYSAIISDMH